MNMFIVLVALSALDFGARSEKRAHNEPHWLEECWDRGEGHFVNPICELLTGSTQTTTTTTPSTTTTTTTTTEPTTTTTEATTTTTEATTTTTTLPPTTTPRTCDYETYNDSNIKDTDFGTDIQKVGNASRTLNDSVHVNDNLDHCKSTCAHSLLQDNFECWAFTFDPGNKCYLFYYSRPLMYVPSNLNFTGTTLYLKRCSDDPFGNRTRSTPNPSSITAEILTPETTESTQVVTISNSSPSGITEPQVSNHTTTSTGPTTATTAATTGGLFVQPGGGGIVQVSSNSFQINGVPVPNGDRCNFLNKTFASNESWMDTCRYNCSCIDTANNRAICRDTCVHYTIFPSNCKLEKKPGDCCETLNCTGPTPTPSPALNGTDCVDMNDTCLYYPDSACRHPYEPWARANCPLRCDFCPGKAVPCINEISYCDRFDLDDACTSYEGWARKNCRLSCSKCNLPGWNPDGVNVATTQPSLSTISALH